MSARDTNSARRRREGQLRSWLRHERMTVRMVLSAARHHSASKCAGPATHDAYEARRSSAARRKRCSSSRTTNTAQGGGQLRSWSHCRSKVLRGIFGNVDCTPLVKVLDVPVPRTADKVDAVPHECVPMVEVEQLVPQERVQQRTFGEVGAVLVSGLLDGLEQLVPEERVRPRIGEHIHALGELVLLQRVQQRTAQQVAHRFHVPHQRAQQRSEHVVDVHLPQAKVSARHAEQVVDVSVLRVDPVFAQVQQQERVPTRAASTALDAPQEHFDSVSSNFSPAQKKCELLGGS